ncbi:hypothetical protein [Paraglaciecola polaris]|uniref:Uncharacterized protein n=1 Tax=Paraglaciecola polaris LMG 21857 TaxID=1129793 RepID=K6YJK8_9ALTE|nr:hypothetical protein [Paraglaciecola polaris]GAC32909.1 hypothetical protein GPLA_2002 [Paraglaciecola polaris LMG 21857]
MTTITLDTRIEDFYFDMQSAHAILVCLNESVKKNKDKQLAPIFTKLRTFELAMAESLSKFEKLYQVEQFPHSATVDIQEVLLCKWQTEQLNNSLSELYEELPNLSTFASSRKIEKAALDGFYGVRSLIARALDLLNDQLSNPAKKAA